MMISVSWSEQSKQHQYISNLLHPSSFYTINISQASPYLLLLKSIYLIYLCFVTLI